MVALSFVKKTYPFSKEICSFNYFLQLPLDQPQQATKDGDQAGGVGEPEVHPDAQDELGGRADEPDDQSRPGAVLQKSVQSPTIPGVVLRCVSVQQNINCTQLITSTKLGTSLLRTNQAEQHHSREEKQASPQSSQTSSRDQGEQIPCESPQPGRAREIGRAEQQSSSPECKTCLNNTEENKSQAEHLQTKPHPYEAGGTRDPAPQTHTPVKTNLNQEILAELNPITTTHHTPQHELNKTATPILPKEEDIELPPVTQAELNNDTTAPQPQPINKKPHPPAAGGTLDPAPQTPTIKLTNLNNELNTLKTTYHAQNAKLNSTATTELAKLNPNLHLDPTPVRKAELNNAATAVLDEPDHHPKTTTPPTTTQAEPNNSAPPRNKPIQPTQAELNNTATRVQVAVSVEPEHPQRIVTPTPATQAELNKPAPTRTKSTKTQKVDGGRSDKVANTPTNHPTYSTPKRKRSPKKNQVETPKFPRLTLENQKKPNHVPNPRNKPLKPNPHPHCNQKQFVKIDTKLQLIKHQGLAITTKKKRPKTEPNPLETKPVTPKKPIVETKPSTPRRFPSKDFTQLAKMFQLHTPPSRLISKQKPKPGNQENLNPIHCNKNQIEPEKTVQVLKRQNLTSQTQPSCLGPSVKTRKNSEKCQKSTNPPPPTVNFRQNPSKNHLTEENQATPPLTNNPPLATLSHPTLPEPELSSAFSKFVEGKHPTNQNQDRI